MQLAARAGAKRVCLFRHDPDHDDSKLEEMVAHAQQAAVENGSSIKVSAAREGETVVLERRSILLKSRERLGCCAFSRSALSVAHSWE